MKRYIDKNEIITLFFWSYFKYSRIAINKHQSEDDKASMNAYRTFMRILGTYSKEDITLSADLVKSIREYIVPTQNLYARIFASVMDDALSFIRENVLMPKEERRLLEQYV